MGQVEAVVGDSVIARNLATRLEDIADRLGHAGNAAEFLTALQDNGAAWEMVQITAARFGWSLSRRELDFSRALSARSHRLSDHDVEVLIGINRRLASSIASGALSV